MSKELIENLLIEFDEMGFEPTTLCDTKKEIDSFRNRLKQVLDYLKAIDNAKSSEFKIVNYKGQYYLQINVNDDEATQIQLPLLEDEIKDVQLAIDKFKQINQANPSEALKCLDKMAKQIELDEDTEFWEIRNAHKTVEQALIKSQEQEKVLEIIFEKNVNIGLVKVLGSVGQYNQTYVYDNMRNVKWCLTEEDFELLKRYCDEQK